MHNYFLSIIGDVKGKKVLEAGCSSGYANILLAQKGAKITLLDNEAGLEKIEVKNTNASVIPF